MDAVAAHVLIDCHDAIADSDEKVAATSAAEQRWRRLVSCKALPLDDVSLTHRHANRVASDRRAAVTIFMGIFSRLPALQRQPLWFAVVELLDAVLAIESPQGDPMRLTCSALARIVLKVETQKWKAEFKNISTWPDCPPSCDLSRRERDLLHVLEWNINPPTVMMWLQVFRQRAGILDGQHQSSIANPAFAWSCHYAWLFVNEFPRSSASNDGNLMVERMAPLEAARGLWLMGSHAAGLNPQGLYAQSRPMLNLAWVTATAPEKLLGCYNAIAQTMSDFTRAHAEATAARHVFTI